MVGLAKMWVKQDLLVQTICLRSNKETAYKNCMSFSLMARLCMVA